MNTVESYLNLVPAANRQKPKFIAMIDTCGVRPMVQLQEMMASMLPKFDVDVAVGDQQDILGEWIGVSRDVIIPISGVYFEWDGPPELGFDFGVWIGNGDPNSITQLPDDTYRLLQKAKIGANKWDGTTDGAYAVWDEVFTDFSILISDNLDMSYDLIVVGTVVDTLTQAIIRGGYVPLKPEGVRVRNYFFPVDDNPIFGWNVDSEFLAGWNEGSWARRYAPIV